MDKMGQGAAERWEAARAALDGGTDCLAGGNWCFWAGLLCLLLFLYLLYHIFRRRRPGQQLYQDIRRLDLDENGAALLRTLAREEGDGPRLTRNAEAFENAVDRYLTSRGGPGSLSEEDCDAIAELRHQLGYRRGENFFLHSTRQLQKGTRLRLRQGKESGNSFIEARVASVREDVLEIRLLDDGTTLDPGAQVHTIVLSRRGRYSFSTEIHKLRPGENRCLLRHTTRLARRERRRYKRVEIRGPVECRLEDAEEAEWQPMELIDLSVVGAKLKGASLLGEEMRRGQPRPSAHRISLRFVPAEFLDDTDPGEGMQDYIQASGVLIDCEKAYGKTFVYRLDLDEVDEERRDLLFKVLYLMQTRQSR